MELGEGEECNIGLALAAAGSTRRRHDEEEEDQYCHCTPSLQFHMLFPPKPDQEEEEEEKPTKINMENAIILKDRDDSSSSRKKLKLTKEQSTLLEHSFTHHHTLNLRQKQELADRLNLMPRQVEVWFQNRRARDKLKKTEADCEMLRKWCEGLSCENRRLKMELQELRSGKPPTTTTHAAARTVTMMSTTVLTLCPSCEQECDLQCNT